MKQRLISAFFGIIVFFAVIFSNTMVMGAAVFIITLVAIYEALGAFGLLRFNIPTVLCFLSAAMPWAYLHMPAPVFAALLVFYILFFMACPVFWHGKISFADSCRMVSLSAVVTVLLWHILLVRNMENGHLYIWLAFLGAWISDTFAYFTGYFFGKHKLAPEISPKKTIEGSMGGIIGTAVVFVLTGVLFEKAFSVSNVNVIAYGALGVICSAFGQIGDLSASVIKRECGIKDFGKIMPGHGGVLDRFDSVLFTAPLVYYFINLIF